MNTDVQKVISFPFCPKSVEDLFTDPQLTGMNVAHVKGPKRQF